jgi:hypothetical protein
MITKPVGISETDLYAAIEDAVSRSLTLVHSWRAGELLLVDNHTMLHSRARSSARGTCCGSATTIRFTQASYLPGETRAAAYACAACHE